MCTSTILSTTLRDMAIDQQGLSIETVQLFSCLNLSRLLYYQNYAEDGRFSNKFNKPLNHGGGRGGGGVVGGFAI